MLYAGEAAGAYGQGAGAEVSRTLDVVWRVADDDELFGREVELRVFAVSANSSCLFLSGLGR